MLSQLKLTWDDWREAAAGKTGQIFAIPFEAIALLTGVTPAAARRVGDVATGLGVVFQAADDVLDLYGDKGRERPGNDLREGRVTALVTAHLGENTDDERALVGLLAQPRQTTTDEQVQRWAERFVQRGTLTRIQQQITEEIDALRRITVPECAELSSCMVSMATRLATPLQQLCDAAEGARSEM